MVKIILKEAEIKNDSFIELHCDNKTSISIAHNSIQHDMTKAC